MRTLKEFENEIRRRDPEWDEKMNAARKKFKESGGLSACTVNDITDLIMMDRGDVRQRTDVQ